ncbi:sigma-54-dependent Fis family transcriptional regulator [Aneurinibacillus danicus]|jgi:transcriptional regulator of acetoin/glycerol metabolism|uniref:Signal-transduction and transcriptional-control protein n=1 Tax=Aneurinibacillus danicus TaxID=267746 RepID=A0A511VBC3_9BACL|nr:sigma-54-dependent Fis family transcriptional regulator [Aneurinibacillus danicus]GEN36119.1 signal-transduction and transcriptional-control protein [Aneurinibacillus danicus]
MSPYLAFHSTSELYGKMKELENLWEKFVLTNSPPEKLRYLIYESWKRCQEYEVDPKKKQSAISLNNDQLLEIMNHSRLFEAAVQIMDDLSKQIRGTGYLATLCDSEGRIIYLDGDQKVLKEAELMNFLIGADWSEKAIGTNAIGTSLATGHPVQIFSAEHYCQGCHPWICSSAPIKDPLTGRILGVVDLTGLSFEAQPHTLGIATMTANFIQKRYKEISYSTLQYLHHYFTQVVKRKNGEAIILFDLSFNIINGTEKALKLLNIQHWQQIGSIPGIKQLQNFLLNQVHICKESYLDQLKLHVHVEEINIQLERIGFLVYLQPQQSKDIVSSPGFCYDSSHQKWSEIIGQSEKFQSTIRKCQLVAPTSASVLITGESGTGKERIARTLHQTSLRHNSPFLAINCGSIPKELMASELFGYEPGTFTGGNSRGKRGKFEEANGGTLFLDEIGEMPLDLQVHLLRVLQEKEIVRLGSSHPIPVDVRIIAATHQNIPKLIQEGKFRTDLYYRLNVVELHIPPLRERDHDIILLTEHFLKRFSTKYNKTILSIDTDVISFFKTCQWPGNIRELENTIEHAVLFCLTNKITLSDLPRSLLEKERAPLLLQSSPNNEEKSMIIRYIEEANGNLSEVARRLNIARTTLYRKMDKYGISKH